jgi:hypothetical protein
MSSVEDAIGSMALMMLRQRNPDAAVGREEIEKAVGDCAQLLARDMSAEQLAAIASATRERSRTRRSCGRRATLRERSTR